MKKYAFLIISILAILALGACSDSDNITNVPNTDGQPDQTVTAGDIHNELLAMVYNNGDLAKCNKSAQVSIVANAANELLARYGLDPMSDAEIEAGMQLGRMKAQMDPVKLVSEILNPTEQEWWDRFSWEAKISDARKVYRKHCELYGTPVEGGMLAKLLDMGLASSEFWGEYRADDTPTYHNPYLPAERAKSWRGVLRFVVAVAVDGTCGAATSAGGAAAAVIGGLASIGADTLIFGD